MLGVGLVEHAALALLRRQVRLLVVLPPQLIVRRRQLQSQPLRLGLVLLASLVLVGWLVG